MTRLRPSVRLLPTYKNFLYPVPDRPLYYPRSQSFSTSPPRPAARSPRASISRTKQKYGSSMPVDLFPVALDDAPLRRALTPFGWSEPRSVRWLWHFVAGQMKKGTKEKRLLEIFMGDVNGWEMQDQMEKWDPSCPVQFDEESVDRFARAMETVGAHLFCMKDLNPAAKYMLGFATEYGLEDAARILVHMENTRGQNTRENITAPAKARMLLERAVAEGTTDWQIMTTYAHMLQKPQQPRVKVSSADRELSYKLAVQADALVEPGEVAWSEMVHGIDHRLHPPAPWRLAASALPDDSPLRDQWIRKGAFEYDDPEAWKLLARQPSMEPHSEEWMWVTTKAAMAGSDHASLTLAKYYLAQTAIYPPGANPAQHNTTLPFDWLEVAAHQSLPDVVKMARIYLLLAYICREQDDLASGRMYLESGMTWVATSQETDAAVRVEMARQLQGYIDDWNANLRVKRPHINVRFLAEDVLGSAGSDRRPKRPSERS